MLSQGLTKEENVEGNKSLDIYDQAMRIRQEKGFELSLDQKLRVLDNLKGIDFKIDFSGGDPLVCSENLKVLKYAAKKYGKERISITTTGVGLSKIKAEEIIPFASELEFTYDYAREMFDPIRPTGYNELNLKKVSLFNKEGIKVKALVPLSKRNISPKILKQIYKNLHLAGIGEVELMRYFPVGRGFGKNENMPSRKEYEVAIELFQKMEQEFRFPKVILQCALRCMYASYSETPCKLYSESLGITAKGILLSCAWAIGPKGEPLDEIFVLGNLVNNSINELLTSEKGRSYERRLNENFGHCKIFAYINSRKSNSFDRLFDKTDPFHMNDLKLRKY